MKSLFEKIVSKFKSKDSISEITSEIKLEITNKKIDISQMILAFINYLRINYLNKNNYEVFSFVEKYFSGEVSLKELSEKVFLTKILIDQDKRDSNPCQFHHSKEETFLDEIFRVIYEFTREDLQKPKGVCYDFCLFIAGLSIAKNEKRKIYMWNSIERATGETNFILITVENDMAMVYDPFNGIYLPLKSYDLVNVGFNLIELNNENILKESINLTGYNHKIIYFTQVLSAFDSINKSEADELETFKKLNYYQRLSVDSNATFDQIRVSFRKLISKYHPDINPSPTAKEMTQLIIEAYECLKNDNLRQEYDFKLNYSRMPVKTSNPSPTPTSKGHINFDEVIEKIIRDFIKKYNINSYKDILEALHRMSEDEIRREAGRNDAIYYNNIIYNNNIYNNLKIIKK